MFLVSRTPREDSEQERLYFRVGFKSIVDWLHEITSILFIGFCAIVAETVLRNKVVTSGIRQDGSSSSIDYIDRKVLKGAATKQVIVNNARIGGSVGNLPHRQKVVPKAKKTVSDQCLSVSDQCLSQINKTRSHLIILNTNLVSPST